MGQLVELDASPFPWLEDRGPTAALHGLIDDATSIPLALWFRPTEDLHGYTTVLGQTCRQYGVPVTLYGDRLSLFQRNDRYWTLAEELRGHQDPTHFGRMLQALGIGFIAAQSPQAKGRIERLRPTAVLSPRSEPARARQRAQHQQRARGPQLQTAVAALAHTLRARRTPAALSVGTDGERPGAAEPHDLVGGGYVGIPRRGPNPGAPGAPSRRAPVPRHPWRTTFSPRQRRLNAAKRG